jgi:hypothetical protein
MKEVATRAMKQAQNNFMSGCELAVAESDFMAFKKTERRLQGKDTRSAIFFMAVTKVPRKCCKPRKQHVKTLVG